MRVETYLRRLRWWLGTGPHGRRAAEEVEAHLRDAAASLRADGRDEEAAERDAVARFGSPTRVGAGFLLRVPGVLMERLPSVLLVASAAASLAFAVLIIGFGVPPRLLRGDLLGAWSVLAIESALSWVAVGICAALLVRRRWLDRALRVVAPAVFLLGAAGVVRCTLTGHVTGDFDYWLYLLHGNLLAQGLLASIRFRPVRGA